MSRRRGLVTSGFLRSQRLLGLNISDSLPNKRWDKASSRKTEIFTSKNKSKERPIFFFLRANVNVVTALPVQMCVCVFHFSCGVSDKSLCICARTHTHTLQYAGCHSYQNANLTASLLQTTFTQKKRVALPSIHPFIHSSTCPPIVEKWNTLKRSYTTQSMPVCVCVLNIRVYVACMHIAMATSRSNWRHHFKTTFTASKERKKRTQSEHTHTLSSCYWCGLIFRWAHPIRSTGSSGT